MPLISIIIPIYNCERHISHAIESVLGQPLFDQCELILVSDGSTDQSEAICRRYAQQHANLHLITQENRGVSAARNTGIDAAQGKYLMFLDADDAYVDGVLGAWLLPELSGEYDVIMFSAYNANSDRNRYGIDMRLQDAVLRGGTVLSIPGHFASGLYRREMLQAHHIRFLEGIRLNEDQVFSLQAMYAAQTIRIHKEFCYIYYKAPRSSTHSYFKKEDRVLAWQKAYDWFDLHAVQNKEQMLAYCRLKIGARMLLYASDYAQTCLTQNKLLSELERKNMLPILTSLTPDRVMPYQKTDLHLFQTNLKRFIRHAQINGLKISLGRRVLLFRPIRRMRDRRIYPLQAPNLLLSK